MSARHEWASARYTIVNKAARPGQIVTGEDENEVAAVQLVHGSDGDSLVVTGRPEDLVTLFRQALAAAEEIVVETMREPELRAMYALPDPADAVTSSVAGIASIMPGLS